MSSWLDALQKEIQEELSSSHMMEPNTDIAPEDHIVGEIADDLKGMYSLALRLQKTALDAHTASHYETNKEHQEAQNEQAQRLAKKSELLLEIFWISIKEQYDLWGKPSVGVRRGWKAVWSEPTTPPVIELFKKIFGGE
ncbi:MAG: hypothetical protein HY566_03260 [Candidatus Kerfeldbacteria bacterium]|nr:hypothetical protein [Candidatus Kerfeldbacteria bacterium]